MVQATDLTLSPNISGTTQRTELNDIIQAIVTGHYGPTRPATLPAMSRWVKEISGTVVEERYWDGTTDMLIATLDLAAQTYTPAGGASGFGKAVVAKTANFLADVNDNANLFTIDTTAGNVTAAIDVTASLGSSWFTMFQKTDATTNTVTIDPDSTNTINGATTLVLTKQYETAIVIKASGTAFISISIPQVAVGASKVYAQGASGPAEGKTVSQVLDLLSSTANVMLFRDVSAWAAFASGTFGRSLIGASTKAAAQGLLDITGSPVAYTVYTAGGVWTKPAEGTVALIETIGAGASGANTGGNPAGGGGGGGQYNFLLIPLSALTSTVTVTVGAGGGSRGKGLDGIDGGNSAFGGYLTSYGGQNGTIAGGGGAGGAFGSGVSDWQCFGGGQGGGGGASGGSVGSRGRHSLLGGGGGGGGGYTGAAGSGGASLNNGNGGAGGYNANATAGVAPGGGGGGCGSGAGVSGAGARGEVRITVF